MDIDTVRVGLIGIASSVLTPLIVSQLSRMFPPSVRSQFDSMPKQDLEDRNNWMDQVGCGLCLAGVSLPLAFYFTGAARSNNPWPVGLAFGLMIILPVLFVSVTTLPQGWRRYQEFRRFYELKYNVSLRTITVVYVLFSGLGIVSAYNLMF